jgi:DNA/RNA-binding domain of Phe-tRNA-synthetase-like protein
VEEGVACNDGNNTYKSINKKCSKSDGNNSFVYKDKKQSTSSILSFLQSNERSLRLKDTQVFCNS